MNWSQKVKERDRYCQVCRTSNRPLQAHHMYSREGYPELQHDVNNGATLCDMHHAHFHQEHGNTDGLVFIQWCLQYRHMSREDLNSIINRVIHLDGQLKKMRDLTVAHPLMKADDTAGTLQKLFDPQNGKFEGYVMLKTSLAESDFEIFQDYCEALNLTPEQGAHWLIMRECFSALQQSREKGWRIKIS